MVARELHRVTTEEGPATLAKGRQLGALEVDLAVKRHEELNCLQLLIL